jgi:hypothetical protein
LSSRASGGDFRLKQVKAAETSVRRRARGETGQINIGSSAGTYFHPLIRQSFARRDLAAGQLPMKSCTFNRRNIRQLS